MSASRGRSFWIGVAIVALACLLRLPTLTWRSLDFDEGASLHFSSLSYPELTTHLADLEIDRHPLTYYIVLRAWRSLAGDADVMIRWPSAFAGILTVALVYKISQRRHADLTAGSAALLVALSPLVIYQHQDARMYALALLFAVLAMGAFWELFERPRLAFAVVSCVALVLATYTHVIAATLFPALGLSVIAALRRRRRTALYGIGALGIAALACAPYMLSILRAGGAGSGGASLQGWLRTGLGAVQTLVDYQTTLGFPGREGFLLGILLALLIAAVWRSRRDGVTVAIWLLTVLLLTIFVTQRIDLFQPKVFVFSAVPLAFLTALAAWGDDGTFRWYGTLPALVILALALHGLSFQWHGRRGREDFRRAAEYVESRATPQDTVVVHVSWARFAFGHYYQQDFVHPFPNNIYPDTPIGALVQPYLDSDVLWLVQAGVDLARPAGDPDRRVQNWLAQRYPVVTAVFPSGVDVRGYATRYRLDALPDAATPIEATYPNGLQLRGYSLPLRHLPARDRWLHPPSTWVPATLYWSVTQPLPADVDVSLSLEDEYGHVWGGELPREDDVRAFHAPRQWQPDEIVRWDFDVSVNPQIPPSPCAPPPDDALAAGPPSGGYKVVVRVHDPQTGAPLEHDGGESWLILGRVCLHAP